MNRHLDIVHGNTKLNTYSTYTGTHSGPRNPIHLMYAQEIPKLQFDKDLLNARLIQWICSHNICFLVVEQPTFQLLL